MSDLLTLSIKFTRPDGLVADLLAQRGKTVLLGRDLSCDVRLDGRKVSRFHLRIEHRSDGAVVLLDNGSHNGTFVNGLRVTEAALLPGDLVQAGEWDGKVELRAPAVTHTPGIPRPRTPGMMPAVQLSRLSSQLGAPFVSGMLVYPDEANGALPAVASGANDGTTDPENHLKRTISASTPRLPAVAPRVTPVPDWKWEDRSPSTDALRTAPVQDNPIIRRFTESQVNLDFRGLSELSQQMHDSTGTGLLPTSPQAVDSIALRLVFKVTEALAQTDSMDQFLAEMCDSLQGAARAKAVIVLLPDDTGALVPRVVKLRRPDERVQLSRTVIEHVTTNRAALTTEDAAADERFARGESVMRFDLKAVLCCPLIKDNVVLGALYLTRDLPFSNTERDLVAALGQLIAMGLERSKLREQYAAAERTRRSLERFHAPDVVRRLMMESTAQSARGDGLFLEPLTATVLFCDLSGFTKWCEANDAEQVGTVLNSYLGAMTEIVFAHGGTVDKFIGDAIMCIFGAPFMTPDDALHAVRCAVEMRRSFRALVGSGACGESARSLDVHIGINSGPVVAGTVGSPKRMEYTALGDTVNIAARLEGVARAGQIVLGPVTASLVCDHVTLRSLGPVSLKGKSETLEAFEVPEES